MSKMLWSDLTIGLRISSRPIQFYLWKMPLSSRSSRVGWMSISAYAIEQGPSKGLAAGVNPLARVGAWFGCTRDEMGSKGDNRDLQSRKPCCFGCILDIILTIDFDLLSAKTNPKTKTWFCLDFGTKHQHNRLSLKHVNMWLTLIYLCVLDYQPPPLPLSFVSTAYGQTCGSTHTWWEGQERWQCEEDT